MSDPLIHSCEDYIAIEPGKKEKVLSSAETLEWIEKWLNQFEKLPMDLQNQPSTKAAAKRLLDTACDLQIKPGFTVQWFAIRLNRPDY